ncbi:MAG TPA: DUF5305 family protein [Methanosarcina sp.]|nr:DUF5305 family protein [Methanosarcina sp.]
MLILCGLWTYEASKPVYEDKNEVITSYTHHGSYTYTVPVTKANPLYAEGTTLKMGLPAYYFAISPTLDMSFTYSLEADDPSDIRGKLQTMVVATDKEEPGTEGNYGDNGSEVEGSGKEEKIFWQKVFPLKYKEGADTWTGTSVTRNFSLNVSEIHSIVKDVQNQLECSDDATIEIVNRVSYTGKVNGENVQGTKDFVIPLVISSSYYQVPEELEFSQDTNRTKKISVKSSPTLSTIKIPLLLFLLNLVFVGTIFLCVKTNKIEPDYIEKLEKERSREPFKEFVSSGKLPVDRNSLIKIEISSLQGLVDAAVDMNSRIIYDSEAGIYFMIHSGVLYIFFDTPKGENKNL